MNQFVGIDLGTTGARSIVYDEAFAILGESYHEYPLSYPAPGWVEQDAEAWWSFSCRAVREALDAAGGPGQVLGLSVSSQSIAVVPTDAAFAPLRPAISWLDTRATAELDDIVARYGRMPLYALTGKRASPTYTLPKLLWLRRHQPEIYSAARWFLLPHDFLLARLTGRPATDHTLASGTMLYDLAGQGWSAEMAGALGIDLEKLPPLAWGGQPAGTLTAAAAGATGLPAGTPVFVGGQDQKCAALAAGLARGVPTVSLGTAAAVEMLGTPKPNSDALPCFNYFAPGQTVLEGVVPTAGLALRWLRDTLFQKLTYRELDDEARPFVGKNRVLFAPYLNGEGSPGWRGSATGGFEGLSLATAPGQMPCAVMEGVAFELRRNLEAMGALPGGGQAAPQNVTSDPAAPATTLRIFGGGAKSPLWRQIIANVTSLPVAGMHTPEMACLGAALLAARGAGRWPPGSPTPASTGAVVAPQPQHAAHYAAQYRRYLMQFA